MAPMDIVDHMDLMVTTVIIGLIGDMEVHLKVHLDLMRNTDIMDLDPIGDLVHGIKALTLSLATPGGEETLGLPINKTLGMETDMVDGLNGKDGMMKD